MPDALPNPDEEWEALLHRWRQQAAATPTPQLYGRVRARLAAPAPLGWLRRPAYALALSLLVLAVSGDGTLTTPAPAPGSPARLARP